MPDIFDKMDVDISPEEIKKSGGDIFDQIPEPEEGWLKSTFRSLFQIPKGIAQATPYGIATNTLQALALGESELDTDDLMRWAQLSEEMGIPFDVEDFQNRYNKSRKEAIESIPTVSNIGAYIEEKTGLPLEGKTGFQKAVELGSMGGKFQTGTLSQKVASGTAAGITKAGLDELGAPEIVSDLVGLGVGGKIGSKVPSVGISNKTKPSGLKERGFENLKKPREVSENKMDKINESIKKDFTEISDEIIKDSPVGKTAENLLNNPKYRQESRELLNEAQEIANTLTKETPKESIQASLSSKVQKNQKGFKKNEYDKSYEKYMLDAINDSENATAGQLVEQYRKNNAALGEYFEPGASKALNRAKRDALLDENRAISDVIEKIYPESELHSVFKEGNERWTKIMDAEAVDSFTNELFKDGVNYKKMHDFFDKNGNDRIFKRALGEEGYKDFSTLIEDMITTQKPYSMLKAAKAKGYDNLYQMGVGFIIHPWAASTTAAKITGQKVWKTLMNSMLDKPKLFINWKKGVKDLKKGDFKASEREFNILGKELGIESVNPEKNTSKIKKSQEIKKEALKKFNKHIKS